MARYIIDDCDLQEYIEEEIIEKDSFMEYLDELAKEKRKDILLNKDNIKDEAQLQLLEKIIYDIKKENYLY